MNILNFSKNLVFFLNFGFYYTGSFLVTARGWRCVCPIARIPSGAGRSARPPGGQSLQPPLLQSTPTQTQLSLR